MKEGEDYHIEMKLEIDPSLTVAQADDIKDRIEEQNSRNERCHTCHHRI